jgi:hypothetical protein
MDKGAVRAMFSLPAQVSGRRYQLRRKKRKKRTLCESAGGLRVLGHFGFSYIGLIYLLMLFIPNIVWAKRQPEGYADLAKNENKIFLVFERAGQVMVTVTAVIFSDYNPTEFSAWTAWLIVSGVMMLLYETAWVRYFFKPTLKSFYGSFLLIPIPLASLPVFAFLLLGIYGKVIWLIISSVIIGIGHIGIHIQHLKTIKKGAANE